MLTRLLLTAITLGVFCAAFRVAAQQDTLSSQSQEITFERLKIKEIEDQNKGALRWLDNAPVPAQQRVFTDAESWQKFWRQPAIKAPEVDFATHQVAAVFLGPKPNSGYGVEISKVSYDPSTKRTVVHVVELVPAPGMFYGQGVVYPADIVVFPRMPGTVEFTRTKEGNSPKRATGRKYGQAEK